MNKQGTSTKILTSVLQNESLSLKERGLLVYLLSLDKNTPISKSLVISKSTDGKEAVLSTFNSLIKKGFLRPEEGGKMFHKTKYTIYAI
jgi:hypothetical protein